MKRSSPQTMKRAGMPGCCSVSAMASQLALHATLGSLVGWHSDHACQFPFTTHCCGGCVWKTMPAPICVAFGHGMLTLIGDAFRSERTTLVMRTIVVFHVGCDVTHDLAQNPCSMKGVESGCSYSA